jgi:hypothetical protein
MYAAASPSYSLIYDVASPWSTPPSVLSLSSSPRCTAH